MVKATRSRPDRPDGMSWSGASDDVPVKFAAPVASQVIDRPRLHSLLTAHQGYPVTMIAATAGWGKTLLAASWLAAGAGDRPAAWVNLDAGDDDPRMFWRALAAAMLPVAGPEPAAALRRVAADAVDADNLPGLFAAAVRLAVRPVVLVLDNLHEVQSPSVHAGLVRLIERPPPMLALLVTTRRDPPWPLQRLRLAGLLAEVRAEDLAFRVDEAAALFAQLHVDLHTEQVQRLVERTEGWPAGLRLVALHLAHRPDLDAAVAGFSGDDHSVAGYLVTEVLDRQSPELLQFLRQISTVDVISADLAEALTGRHDSPQLLADLAASHLFVQAVDRPGRWYRLHRLIADILRAQPTTRRERRDLHRRAAEWFRDQGMPLEAISSAVAGQLWPLAADIVGIHLVALAHQGHARSLERILRAVPSITVRAYPELAAGLAGARIIQGNSTDVPDLLAAARAGTARLRGRHAARARLLVNLPASGLARLNGNWEAAAAAHRAVPTDPVVLAGLGIASAEIVPVSVHNTLGTAALWAGDLTSAERHLRAAVETGLVAPALAQLNAAAHRALLITERGELDSAEASARQVISTASAAGLEHTAQVVAAYLAMARILLDRDDLGGIDDWLSRIADVQAVAPEPHIRLSAALVLAARRDAAGDRERALHGLRATTAQLEGWSPPAPLHEQRLACEAGLLARTGNTCSARNLVDQIKIDQMETATTPAGALGAARLLLRLGDLPAATAARARVRAAHTARIRTEIAVLDTLLALAMGNQDQAADRLEDALAAAAPWALRRPFLAEAVDLRPLLAQRIERGTVAPAFALDLLERMAGATPTTNKARRALVDPLTERERTILRYLASSLSTTEIASELYVSVNTVKTHQRGVYRKLDAKNRRDAVHRARALQLL